MQPLSLYASIGPQLVHYEVDVEGAALRKRGAVALPQNVQYAWPHASRGFLYVVSSNGVPGGPGGDRHYLSALRIDAATGALARHGPDVPLPSRPIHVTTDKASRHVLVAFIAPSGLSVHRLHPDGTIGSEVEHREPAVGGFVGHQVRMFPDDSHAVLVERGNSARSGRPEDPGALKVFRYEAGALTPAGSVAPGGGHGFGPRHLDFHPTRPWLYLTDERHNKLMMFRMEGGAIEARPSYVKESLMAPGLPNQLFGAVHVHPNGKFVYGANRAFTPVDVGGRKVLPGGENSLVAYAIDERTGEPTAIQHESTRGVYCRTFHIDPTGRLLVAGNIQPMDVREGDAVTAVPASLSLFRIGADGRLAFARKYDVDVGGHTMFWIGMV